MTEPLFSITIAPELQREFIDWLKSQKLYNVNKPLQDLFLVWDAMRLSAYTPPCLRELGQKIRAQDNRATSSPLFIVQERKRIYGVDPDYTDDYVWCYDIGGEVLDDEVTSLLDKLEAAISDIPDGYEKVGCIDTWEFVTACFTEKACEDYIRANRHNLEEPRIYTDSANRNNEYNMVRDYLISLPEPEKT